MESKEIITGIIIGIAIVVAAVIILKLMRKGSIIELKRDSRGYIVEIMEREI